MEKRRRERKEKERIAAETVEKMCLEWVKINRNAADNEQMRMRDK